MVMKAVYYEQFRGPFRSGCFPTHCFRWQCDCKSRSNRALPQRLARLDGPRSRYCFTACSGAELAGTITELAQELITGRSATGYCPVCRGCGSCPECRSGNHQICDYSFSGLYSLGIVCRICGNKYADINLVRFTCRN